MRITANKLTIARIVLLPIPAYLIYQETSRTMVVALIIAGILGLTDWIDGILARREGPSVLGGLLDPIADKIFIAALYLPLTERGVIPVWMTACIFVRDFLVTSLRTSLSLRDAPMRTSLLAKFKTAIQMSGIAYVALYLAFVHDPDTWIVWFVIVLPIAFPAALIAYRLVRRQKQGVRSIAMVPLLSFAVVLRYFFGPAMSIQIILYIVTIMTVVSGFSYLLDAWSAFRRSPGSAKEILLFALDGCLVPVSFVLLLGRFETAGMSLMIILIVTFELSVGGLGNLLSSQKTIPGFRWSALKSVFQLLLACLALGISWFKIAPSLPLGELAIGIAFLLTTLHTALCFWRHRASYLSSI